MDYFLIYKGSLILMCCQKHIKRAKLMEKIIVVVLFLSQLIACYDTEERKTDIKDLKIQYLNDDLCLKILPTEKSKYLDMIIIESKNQEDYKQYFKSRSSNKSVMLNDECIFLKNIPKNSITEINKLNDLYSESRDYIFTIFPENNDVLYQQCYYLDFKKNIIKPCE